MCLSFEKGKKNRKLLAYWQFTQRISSCKPLAESVKPSDLEHVKKPTVDMPISATRYHSTFIFHKKICEKGEKI